MLYIIIYFSVTICFWFMRITLIHSQMIDTRSDQWNNANITFICAIFLAFLAI